MSIVLTILFILFILLLFGLVYFYFYIRNYWVFENRVDVLYNGNHNKLPSYDYMLYKKFWIWNIDKFLNK